MVKHASQILKVLLVTLFSLTFVACASRTVVESDLAINGAPDWVNEGKQALKGDDKRFFRGIGSAPAMNDASLQKSTADNRARAEVAQIFSSFMNVVAKDYSGAVSDASETINEQVVSRLIKNSTKLDLIGVEIIARWQDTKTGIVYSLAELDMKKFKTVAATAVDMDARLKKYIDQEADNIFDSMQ